MTERGLNNNKCTVSQFDEVNDTDGSVHRIWRSLPAGRAIVRCFDAGTAVSSDRPGFERGQARG